MYDICICLCVYVGESQSGRFSIADAFFCFSTATKARNTYNRYSPTFLLTFRSFVCVSHRAAVFVVVFFFQCFFGFLPLLLLTIHSCMDGNFCRNPIALIRTCCPVCWPVAMNDVCAFVQYYRQQNRWEKNKKKTAHSNDCLKQCMVVERQTTGKINWKS